MTKAEIGLVGLAVMGENLALNMVSKGRRVAVANRSEVRVHDLANRKKELVEEGKLVPAYSYEQLCSSLEKPRKIFLMVQAGSAIDQTISAILPYLEQGDLLIDGGNSHYLDTRRREKELKEKGILFMGCGVSGGEEGALHGPSMMPGGSKEAWPLIADILRDISAKATEEDGSLVPCVDYVGEDGAGHFVKMVHNGIEYGDMQLIAEGYSVLRDVLKLSYDEMQVVFLAWNKGQMDSYLIEITADILGKKDDKEGSDKRMVEAILDTAGQKGTGKWTAISALDLGLPLTLIGEAVFARCLSSQKEERVRASTILEPPKFEFSGDKTTVIQDLHSALYASKLISYAQGFVLIREAAKEFNWNLNFGSIAAMWRGGCIIRSRFLNNIKSAFDKDPTLENLVLDPFFRKELAECLPGWRRTACLAIEAGIPIPAITSALSYYDGYRTATGNANLIQAQRDYFGAHTFERIDGPAGKKYHFNWTGTGGTTTAASYNV